MRTSNPLADTMRRGIPRLMRSLHSFLLVVTALTLSCSRTPDIVELPPSYDIHSPENIRYIPIILAGQVVANPRPVGEIHPSRFWGWQTQLIRVRVRTEAILQGDVVPGDVDIFYFIAFGNFSGGATLGSMLAGERDLFFLEKDRDHLRTICDGWRACVMRIYSGTHPDYKKDPTASVNEAITDLLLTRGSDTDDRKMIRAIGETYGRFGDGPMIKKLKQLVKQESPAVRQKACTVLKELKESCEQKIAAPKE